MCAYIDKTYLSWEDYLTLKKWCEETKLIYTDGTEGSPKDFLWKYDEPYEGEAPVWNTPEAFDYWLYLRCPFDFIQKRLKEQYGENIRQYFKPRHEKLKGIHYTIISKPKYKIKDKGTWCISVKDIDGNFWWYGWTSNTWYTNRDLRKPETSSDMAHIRNLTDRKLRRLIKKWKLPVGCELRIMHIRYLDTDYKIRIKR